MRVLVLGASGGIGAAVAKELITRRVNVILGGRDEAKLRAKIGRHADANSSALSIDIRSINALDGPALSDAAEGCDAIVFAVNYPYHEWALYMEKALANTIVAAQRVGATIVLPGNIYALGAQTGTPLTEETPDRPCSDKGKLRHRMESALRAATEGRGVRVRAITVRAADFFGPTVRNGAVDPIFTAAVRRKPIRVLGRTDVAHQWAYAPDLAAVMVDLLVKRASLPPYELVNFPGYTAKAQHDFLRLVAQQCGDESLPIKPLAWWMIKLAGWFNPQAREVMELRYLWDSAVLLDRAKLAKLLPDFQPTPIDLAIQDTLRSYRAETTA